MARKESFLARKFTQGTGGGSARTFFFYLGLMLLSYALIHTLVIVIFSFIEYYAIFLVVGIFFALVFLGLTTSERDKELDEEGEETQDAYAPPTEGQEQKK